jgi:hypothetical protein
MSDDGYPIPVKYLPSLAFIICRQRSSTTDETIKPPGKNWLYAFYKRRRSTKSSIIGMVKVMSYEDIETAKERCVASHVAKMGTAGKGRHKRPKGHEEVESRL